MLREIMNSRSWSLSLSKCSQRKRNSKFEAYTVRGLRNGLRWQGVRLLNQYRIN